MIVWLSSDMLRVRGSGRSAQNPSLTIAAWVRRAGLLQGRTETAWGYAFLGSRKYCINHQIMVPRAPLNCCRMCGATSYRHVIARDDSGAMRPSGLYKCSRCNVVFADPKVWREGDQDGGDLQLSSVTPMSPATATTAQGGGPGPEACRSGPVG